MTSDKKQEKPDITNPTPIAKAASEPAKTSVKPAAEAPDKSTASPPEKDASPLPEKSADITPDKGTAAAPDKKQETPPAAKITTVTAITSETPKPDAAKPADKEAKTDKPAAPPAKPKLIDPGDAHVLVVEDNVPNFVLIARLLAYMGIQRCEWKTSGWQVVEFADTLPRIDLILMDIRLPYEDGFQALEKVRSNNRLKDTLVVAVTAEASVEQMKRAKDAGFDGFLGKPLDPDRFPEQIKRVLSGEPVWEMH